jgi:hypothetical protein
VNLFTLDMLQRKEILLEEPATVLENAKFYDLTYYVMAVGTVDIVNR